MTNGSIGSGRLGSVSTSALAVSVDANASAASRATMGSSRVRYGLWPECTPYARAGSNFSVTVKAETGPSTQGDDELATSQFKGRLPGADGRAAWRSSAA